MIDPWKHQKEALNYLLPRDYGALYTKPGSGKTKVMIDLIRKRGFKRTIVVATTRLCRRRTWDKEIQKHSPEGSINVLNAYFISGVKRPEWVRENGNLTKKSTLPEVLIVNYESIWREPFKSFLLNKYKPDCVICDESHKIKGAGSKCSKMLYLIGKRAPNRFLMTGTPMSQNPLDVYAQYRFLAPRIFGTNFTRFKDEYTNQVRLSSGRLIVDKKNVPYKNLDDFREKMFSCAFTCEVDLGLLPTRDIFIEFDLSPKADKLYLELRKEGCLELQKGTVETANILTVRTRLQQLCSGYLPVEDEEGNVRYEQVDDSRQEAFQELLESIPEEEPIIVWAKYRKDIKNIRKICKDMGRKSSEMSGARDTTQNWVDGKTTVLVVQISSGAEGLNELVKARYNIYYTLTDSLAQYKQSRARTDRPGQKRSVVYYILVAKVSKGITIDEKILEAFESNEEVINYIMRTKEI